MEICNKNRSRIIQEGLLDWHAKPMNENETKELLSYKSATCKIKYEVMQNGNKVKGFGTIFL